MTAPAADPFPRLADAIPLGEVRRALVVKLRHHGDVLLTSPVFSALQAAAPQVEIDALVYADTADMLRDHPAIRQLHTIDRNWKKLGWLGQWSAERRLQKNLRNATYDLLIHLTNLPRGARLARTLGVRWAVAPADPRRGGWWKNSFTHLIGAPSSQGRHTVETHLDALRRIGIQPPLEHRALVMVPGPAAEQKVATLLAPHGLSERPFVHVHPASRWRFKCWTTEGMAAVVDHLQAKGLPVVITGAPADNERAINAAIIDRCRQAPLDLTGQLTLKDMAALTRRARLFVGVDSAPMHIAAAVGTPAVALFGPSADLEWGPYGAGHQVIASDRHPCRPCRIDGCGGGKVSDCLVSLPVERVIAAIDRALAV